MAMVRMRLTILLTCMFFCSCNKQENNKAYILLQNELRIENRIPIIDSTWVFHVNGDFYEWVNPFLDSMLSSELPVYAKKTVYFKDSIISEEDLYYSGLIKKSKLIDPPKELQDFERLTIIYNTAKQERKAYSYFCPDFDSMPFAGVKEAELLIEKWGLTVLNY